ncbi:putative Ig domain-containing protein [Massilia antarctica]|uniref:putative Ig domain-containing protein n=1 Tax=Massilia antarctica TaxID=2765360 RepID=UPI00249DBD00|nr:putative Ig domain-containing protein [Massilia antarctica]
MNPIIIDGDDNDNYLYGGAGANVMNGKGGNDFLSGGPGDDTLDGGAGKDILIGGWGNNTFLFGRGAGHDIIDRPGAHDGGRNVLQLGEGVAPSELRLIPDSNSLVVSIAGTQDSVTLHEFFAQTTDSMGGMKWSYPIDEIRFADGMRWDVRAIKTQFWLAFEPMVVLDDSDNRAVGASLDGAGGNDWLQTYVPGLLNGGSGNDTLQGSSSSDILNGGSGDDLLNGGDGNDILDGGAGDDVLNGEGGLNTYRFGYGSGHDTIAGPAQGQDDALMIDMEAGVQAGTLAFLRAGTMNQDLIIQLPQGGAYLTVQNYFHTTRSVTLHFADGTVMSQDTIRMKLNPGMGPHTVTGTAAGDELNGTYDNDIILGGEGNDRLNGQGGDDWLVGGDGNDLLDGIEGNDYLDGGAGNDTIRVGNGASVMRFGRASDHDWVEAPQADGAMTVLLDAGITGADITLSVIHRGPHPDLMIKVGGSGADITVRDYFVLMADRPASAFALQFADGTLWDGTILGKLVLRGDMGSDVIDGTPGNDHIDGAGGNDLLRGLEGKDLLLGGTGADTLLGGEGDDTLDGGQGDDILDDQSGNSTYVFARADGRDVILNNTKAFETRYQTISFANGISPDQVHLRRVDRGPWDDVAITLDGDPGQEITVERYVVKDPLFATNMQLRDIRFADGSVWDAAAILRALTLGTDADETIQGTAGNDLIDGKFGNDLLIGKGGNDTLIGGRGNDKLIGQEGVDTYVFNPGDGRDVLDDAREAGGAGNIIRFGAGVEPYQVYVTARGNGIEIEYSTYGDVIVLADPLAVLPGARNPIERVEFADGSTRSFSDFLNHAPQLTVPLVDQTVKAGQHYQMFLPLWTFIDQDRGDALTVTMSQANGMPLPDWLRFTPDLLSGVAPQGPSVSYQLRATATDRAGLQVSDDFTLTVEGANRAPTVERASDGQSTREGGSLAAFAPRFIDPDAGDLLSVKMSMADGSPLPSWMWFNGTDLLTGKPNFDSAGIYKLMATATDKGGLSVSSNFDISVANDNRAPVPGQAVATLNAAQDTAFTGVLPVKTLVDPDGDAMSYQLTAAGAALPAWLAFDPLTRTLSGTPGTGDAGLLSLVLTATDSAGLSGNAFFKLDVAHDAALDLTGGADADVLVGQSAGDTLLGLAGNDQLSGLAGNDVLDGGPGSDRMAGGAGDDRYLVDAPGDTVVELANEGRDTVLTTVGYTLPANAEVLAMAGTGSLAAYGNGADNVLLGNSGNNFMSGYGGNDILQGGAGNDSLTDNMGKNLFDGGRGVDTLSGGAAADFFIGGAGNDIINPGAGIDIIAFNRGDGSDVVNPSTGLDNVISLGHGIGYGDLTFNKVGSDLLLGTGAGEQINLKNWYLAPVNHSVARLQIFIEGTNDYQTGSPVGMYAKPVQLFDFDALASKFDQALLADSALGSWRLAPELAGAIVDSSATTAFGAGLAQQYASSGTLANVGQVPALAIIGSAAFGQASQVVGEPAALIDGSAFLM